MQNYFQRLERALVELCGVKIVLTLTGRHRRRTSSLSFLMMATGLGCGRFLFDFFISHFHFHLFFFFYVRLALSLDGTKPQLKSSGGMIFYIFKINCCYRSKKVFFFFFSFLFIFECASSMLTTSLMHATLLLHVDCALTLIASFTTMVE